jgi:hypothetical protein
VNEVVIDHNVMAAPAGLPAPAAPTAPAATKIYSHRDAETETEVSARVIPACIWIVQRRPPDVCGIVIRQVHHLRIGGLDRDDGLSGVVRSDDSLLARRRQFPRMLRLQPHSLYGVHHVALLTQERVPKICRPRDVLVQPFDEVRKHHQGLYARVPVLLLCRLGQGSAREPRASLEPLRGLDEFQRIGGRHQDLAYQRIRVECDRRDQIVELIGRQRLTGWGRLRRRLGKQ